MDAAPQTSPPAGGSPPLTGTELTAQAVMAAPTIPVPAPPPVPTPPVSLNPWLPSVVLDAWPRPALWATALLAGLAVILLGVHCLGSLRWGARPTELERGLDYRIDLNRADRAELLQLPGVGENLAQRIIDYRQARGEFQRVEDLLNVQGVGPATLQRLGPWIWVGRDETEEDEPEIGVRQPPKFRAADKPGPAGKFKGRPVRGSKEAALKGKININEASAAELQKLPHIGPKMAQRIIAERKKGRFRSVEDLRRVPGIGPKRLEQLRPYITVENPPDRVAKGP